MDILGNFFLACPENTFGFNCAEKCSQNCKGCSRFNGFCQSGCGAGWKGAFCHIRCKCLIFFLGGGVELLKFSALVLQ